MSIKLDKIPSYSHNGLKVYILPKNEQSQIDEDNFFTTLYETLNDDTDDISFTASFLSPHILSHDYNPVSVQSSLKTIPSMPIKHIGSQISPTKIENILNSQFPTPKINVDIVDESYKENLYTQLALGDKKKINCEAQTNVSLIDEKFHLINSNEIAEVETRDKNIETDRILMHHKSSEVYQPTLTNQSVLTDSIHIFDEHEVDKWKESLNTLESEKIRLQYLLDEKYVNQTKKPQTSSMSVQTNRSTNISTSCQATSNSVEVNSQTINLTNDFSMQHDDITIEKNNLIDEDELSEQKLLELTLQQKQLAWERELRVKIGVIEQLEGQMSAMEMNNQDIQQQNENFQKELQNLNQQINDKDKLISDLEAIRNDNKEFRKLFCDVEIQAEDDETVQHLQQQLEAAEMKERNLIAQTEELMRNESLSKNKSFSNDHNELKYDQLKLKYDDLQISTNDLQTSLFQTHSNIENLNNILQQKDDILRNLINANSSNKNIFNKENVLPLQPINVIEQHIDDYDEENNTSNQTNKKRLPMKSITEVGKKRTKFFQLKLYNNLKQEYLNKPFSKYHEINSSIPLRPSNFHCIKQKNGKVLLTWYPQHSQTVVKYRLIINDARTIMIENTGSGKYELILNESELSSSIIRLHLKAINTTGLSSDASHLTISNSSTTPSISRSRSTNYLSNIPPQQYDLQSKRLCIAVYDYTPSKLKLQFGDVCELKFETGDFIETFGSHRPDGFYYARLRGSEIIGLVPKHFIEEIRQLQMPYLK